MLKRRGLQAIQALLELALQPESWRSGPDLAASQAIPEPMLEQVLLQLRRAELVEARRGRHGGYRLQRAAAAIPLLEVLRAVEADPSQQASTAATPEQAGEQVALALESRLQLALERELARLTLEELLYDLRSTQECLRQEGGLMLG
ncbi:Rrf2 family transcriptional regulator [Synechococcus sp. CS-205]|jgi:Rrf2 family iron-sulfur cluster assembly transcriptional regulator|uniref:Rrf2 family transcriptional regulator n=1 Tax=Synechococcus sp. CS-205 TaxID=2847984 RepID=UPI00223B075C|nr:Rrf2 family transcriptional regulator [Synechococcus sp. CS-205]MCT0248819.1 Rrf2 family transcriptional regulator [Synechococcus sp. CS-205]